MGLLFGRYRWVSFGFILLTSCVTMGKISVQVPVSAPKAIPNDIQSVVLMNGSMTDAFKNLNQDSLENFFVKKKLNLDDQLLDSVAADTTLKSIANFLYESGRYDVVIPVKRNLPNYNVEYYNKSRSLGLAETRQICTEFNVDAILMMENFSEKVNTSYRIDSYKMMNFNECVAYIQVAYHSNWKLYHPKEKLLMAKFEVNDTIFWERSGMTLQETYEKLPTIKEALLAGAVENAQNLAAYISPGWKQDQRSYFITKNEEADKAIAWLRKNNWKEAEKIWLKFSTSTSASFRSKVEFNLALAAEMNGNLKEALRWAKKSLQSDYSNTAENYIQLLNKRSEIN